MIPGQTSFTYVTRDHDLFACLQKRHKIKISDDVDALEDLLLEIACSIRSTLQSDFDEIEQLKE